jgi:hypothetical protein
MSADGAKDLHAAAMKLSILPEETEESTSPPVIEPAPGSYEKLMGMFPAHR